MKTPKWAPVSGIVVLAVISTLLLVQLAYSQAVAAATTVPPQAGKAKVIFYYGRPVPLKNCMQQVGIVIDNAPVHQIYQYHVWQTELTAGTHVIRDDNYQDDKGALTMTVVAGQTYYLQGTWHKGWGPPNCGNMSVRFVEMKPKDVQKASALLGKPNVDETVQAAAAAAPELKPTTVKLSIVSTPEAADIEVDGSFMGNTPSAIELSPGEHTVSVTKAGYKDWQRKIKLAAGDIRLNAQLEQEAPKP